MTSDAMLKDWMRKCTFLQPIQVPASLDANQFSDMCFELLQSRTRIAELEVQLKAANEDAERLYRWRNTPELIEANKKHESRNQAKEENDGTE